MECKECYLKMALPPCDTCPKKTGEDNSDIINNFYSQLINYTKDFNLENIESSITTNVPDIVHCEECKYYHQEIRRGIHYFNFDKCTKGVNVAYPKFYCAYGEKK